MHKDKHTLREVWRIPLPGVPLAGADPTGMGCYPRSAQGSCPLPVTLMQAAPLETDTPTFVMRLVRVTLTVRQRASDKTACRLSGHLISLCESYV
jgi:hypothetical protein